MGRVQAGVRRPKSAPAEKAAPGSQAAETLVHPHTGALLLGATTSGYGAQPSAGEPLYVDRRGATHESLTDGRELISAALAARAEAEKQALQAAPQAPRVSARQLAARLAKMAVGSMSKAPAKAAAQRASACRQRAMHTLNQPRQKAMY